MEDQRIQASIQSQFNIYEVFRFFDSQGVGIIYCRDFIRGLHALSKHDFKSVTDTDIALLIKTYS